MSLFSWLMRKPAPVLRRGAEPSSPLNANAAASQVQGRGGKSLVGSVSPEHAASRKHERTERRELLYTVVRDAMVRAGVLSASYKFKVLALDPRGLQFLVMVDLAREYGGETVRLSEIEALIVQSAKTRYDIAVSAVYWRINDHLGMGMSPKGGGPQGAGLPPAHPLQPAAVAPLAPAGMARAPVVGAAPARNVAPAPAPTPAPAPAPAALAGAAAPVRLVAPRFDPIEADEVAAFKRALATAAAARVPVIAAPGVSTRSAARNPVPGGADFPDTEMPEHDSRAQSLSSTQYGDL